MIGPKVLKLIWPLDFKDVSSLLPPISVEARAKGGKELQANSAAYQ